MSGPPSRKYLGSRDWNAELAASIDEDNETLLRWREFGEKHGIPEAKIVADLAEVAKSQAFRRDILRTAAMLDLCSSLLRTPRWRLRRRERLRVEIKRFESGWKRLQYQAGE